MHDSTGSQPEGARHAEARRTRRSSSSGDLVFTAGQVGVRRARRPRRRRDRGADQACAREPVAHASPRPDAASDDVLKVNAFLVDLGDFEAYNAVYREFFERAVPGPDDRRRGAPRRDPASRSRRWRGGPRDDAAAVDTPAAVVDLDRLERNLARWQEYADRSGSRTGRTSRRTSRVEIARRQLALGAIGLTCQKLGEAETMVGAGSTTCSSPTTSSARRSSSGSAALLAPRGRHGRGRRRAPAARARRRGAAAGRELGVLVDCDTGLGRTGVATPDGGGRARGAVARTGSLRFDGFLTYPALPERAVPSSSARRRARRGRGLAVACVSAGGTPTMWESGALRPTVTEYRVGTYAFHDRTTVAAGAATLDDVALTVHATVVSRPAPRPRDPRRRAARRSASEPRPRARTGSCSRRPARRSSGSTRSTHTSRSADGDELELGDRVRVVPNHACVGVNLFDELVVVGARRGRRALAGRRARSLPLAAVSREWPRVADSSTPTREERMKTFGIGAVVAAVLLYVLDRRSHGRHRRRLQSKASGLLHHAVHLREQPKPQPNDATLAREGRERGARTRRPAPGARQRQRRERDRRPARPARLPAS